MEFSSTIIYLSYLKFSALLSYESPVTYFRMDIKRNSLQLQLCFMKFLQLTENVTRKYMTTSCIQVFVKEKSNLLISPFEVLFLLLVFFGIKIMHENNVYYYYL